MGSTKNLAARRRLRQRQYQRLLPQMRAVYKELLERFPHAFVRDPTAIRPLHKDVTQDIRAVLPYKSRVLHGAINLYMSQRAYVRAMAEGKPRIDLSGHEVEIVTEEGREQARTQLKTMSRRRWESRQADKGKEPDEGASLIPGTSGETVTEAQVGTVTEAQSGMVTDEQEQRQPTTARRKTTSKRRRPSDEVDKVKDQDEEAPLSSGTPVDAVTDEKQQTTARVKTTRKRNGEASKVDKAL